MAGHFLLSSCLSHSRQQDLLGLFLSSYHPVAPFVELWVFDLQLRMLHEIGNTAAHTFIKAGGSLETWYRSLQLGTVKDDGNGLVAQQVALEVTLSYMRRNSLTLISRHLAISIKYPKVKNRKSLTILTHRMPFSI